MGKDTGCSDWEAQAVGDMMTATSDLDCLNKCLDVTGASYANYQAAACHDATLGAKPGACYCFSDCAMTENTCWDLIATSPTGVDPAPAPAPLQTSYEKIADRMYCPGGNIVLADQLTWEGDTVAECAEAIVEYNGKNSQPPCMNNFVHAHNDADRVCECCLTGEPADASAGQGGGRLTGYKIVQSVTAASASAVAEGSTTTSTTGVR